MSNTLGAYNPIFYAQEALIALENALGMASRVHRGYDEERRAFRRGETTTIRRPSTFSAQDAPSSAQDLDTGVVNVTLDHWKEVKFALTDKELAFTGERIINEHIRPAAYALANDIDQRLAALSKQVPWFHNVSSAAAVSDITAVRRIMFDNAVPLNDPTRLHQMVDGAMESEFLNLSAFTQMQGAGDLGVNSQRSGSLGTKFGFEIFANQNVQPFTAGAITATAPATVGAKVKGDLSVVVGDTTLTGTAKAGDIITFSGIKQKYVIIEDATAADNAITLKVAVPGRGVGLLSNVGAATSVTLTQQSAVGQGLAFHRNAFAFVTAPLSEMGNGRGADIATAVDPITGLSLRARLYYMPDTSQMRVALDVLYGFEVLDSNLAVRINNVS